MQLALLASRLEDSPLYPEFWTLLDVNSGRARDFGRGFSGGACSQIVRHWAWFAGAKRLAKLPGFLYPSDSSSMIKLVGLQEVVIPPRPAELS